MEDRIYLKTRNDGLWEKNATKGAAVYMIVGTVLFLAKNPDVYYAIPDSERTSLRKAFCERYIR